MTITAREIMSPDLTCLGEDDSLLRAAVLMCELDVGALPVCNGAHRVQGMISDRDIVVRCLACGADPGRTTAGDLVRGPAITIGADDDVQHALDMMAAHRVRRLPVLDGEELIGIVSQADVARTLPPERVGTLVSAISY